MAETLEMFMHYSHTNAMSGASFPLLGNICTVLDKPLSHSFLEPSRQTGIIPLSCREQEFGPLSQAPCKALSSYH